MRIRRLVGAAGAAVVAGVLVAAPVGAHVEADPGEAKAGATTEITFSPEHGCDDDLATTSMEITVADGVTNPQPGNLAGWTSTVNANVVTFTGGSLPYHDSLGFPVTMTMPDTADTTLYFPVLQRCGTEGVVRWIEIPQAGQTEEDLEDPAPAVVLTASGSEGAAPEHDEEASTDEHSDDSTDEHSDDSSALPYVIGGVVIVAVGVGAFLVIRSRRSPSSQ